MTTGSTATAIFYPETDGMPLPDGEFQAPIYVSIQSTLRSHFKRIRGARVNGDTFIYYIEGNPRRFVSPDCYVAINLSDDAIDSIERNNVYLLWEVGKAPDFILEIASPSTANTDRGRKRDLYADLGVSEYWRYDSTGGDFYGEPLVGERLVDGEYQRLERGENEDGVWSHSDVLNLDLWWLDGELRFWDPVADTWLLNQEQEHARAEQERARAKEERTRAEQEAARAEQEAARAEQEAARAEQEAARAHRAEVERDAEVAARLEAEAELRRLRERLAELE